MRLLRSKKWIVLAAFAVGAAVGAGVAIATVTNPIPTVDTNTVREKIVHSEFVPSADQPEFSSGWHKHPGPVIVQVQDGSLKITQNTCNPTVVGAGETFVETPDIPVLAEANKAVTWTSTLILPNSTPGTADRVAATSPC